MCQTAETAILWPGNDVLPLGNQLAFSHDSVHRAEKPRIDSAIGIKDYDSIILLGLGEDLLEEPSESVGFSPFWSVAT